MINLHIISQTGGSIGEITDALVPHFRKNFTVTEEFKKDKPEIPEELDILLMHFVNPQYVQSRVFDYFKYKVLIQPVDGTELKPEYIDLINKFDLIICPSIANRKILIRNGVPQSKIKVIPNFVRKKEIFSHIEDDTFTFYTELFFQKRKNLNAIIDFYKTAFDMENVELIVKSNLDPKQLKAFKNDLRSYSTKSKVTFINQYYLDSALYELWQKTDCYINLSGIEGFGIPMLRFALNKVPIISIRNPNSGYIEFLDSDYYIDDFRFEKEADLELYTENSLFAHADKEEAIRVMKSAYYNSSVPRNGLDLQLYREYNIESIKQMYLDEILAGYYEKVGTKPGLKVESRIKIKYTSPYGTSGYAIAGKEYIQALAKKVQLQWNPMHFGDEYTVDESYELDRLASYKLPNYSVNLLHSTPEWWPDRIEKGKLNVGYTVWETDKLHPDWPNYINCVDIVFVPSQWNKDVLIESGVTKPIYVIPHIAPEITIRKEKEDDTYRFYTIGQWTTRKGTEDTLRSYLEEFNGDDNVELVIKTFLNSYGKYEVDLCERQIQQIISEYPNPAKVKIVWWELSYDSILEMHRENDCYISACKAEGWGLGAFEAALHRNPVIMTGFGGQTEFLDVHPELIVDYELIPVKGMGHIPWYLEEQNWAKPDLNDFKSKMRKAATNKYSGFDYQIKERFNGDLITKKILEAIMENG